MQKKEGPCAWLWHCSSPFWLAVRGETEQSTGETPQDTTQAATDTVPVDYSDSANWAYYAEGAGKDVDVFLICPTVDMGDNGNYNMSLEDTETKIGFRGCSEHGTGDL